MNAKNTDKMNILRKILFLGAVAVLAAACCPCRSYQKRTRRPLEGTAWQLIQLGGRSIQPQAGHYVVVFSQADGSIAAEGACNTLSGSYTADDKRALHIGPLRSTRMTCPDIATEQAFAAALESTTHYDMDGPMLLLLSDGELRAVFQAAE